jgi:hypothetical protein
MPVFALCPVFRHVAGTRFRVANAPQQGLMITVKVATPNG